jgi:hypothetical protein
MRSSTRSESNGNPCDNINNNSNDVEKPVTTPPSSSTPAAIVSTPLVATTPNVNSNNNGNNNRACEDVIDISSSPSGECNSKPMNQPATNDNELIQRAEPVENSEKKVNVYEQVRSTIHLMFFLKHFVSSLK